MGWTGGIARASIRRASGAIVVSQGRARGLALGPSRHLLILKIAQTRNGLKKMDHRISLGWRFGKDLE